MRCCNRGGVWVGDIVVEIIFVGVWVLANLAGDWCEEGIDGGVLYVLVCMIGELGVLG